MEQCKIQIREMVQSLEADIGSIRTVGRYHREGTRTLESDYAMTSRVLGAGINGCVQLATGRTHRRDIRCAVKTFDLKALVAKHHEGELLSELRIHMTVDHPHIVKVIDIYEAGSQLHVVMECMDGGELFDRMCQRKVFQNDEAAEIIHQMLLAVAYLHDLDIVHRDLKPENFLFDCIGGSHLKLTDFGFSTWWNEGDTNLQVACGTLHYAAPEVLKKSYTKKCDLWSVGVLAFGLLGGYLPFDGSKSEISKNIKACRYTMYERRWASVSENARAFVFSLLRPEDQQRSTANEALEHPWLLERPSTPQSPGIHDSLMQAFRNFQHASRLQQTCCSIAALSACSTSMGHQLRSFFLQIDVLGTGVVKLEDLKRALLQRAENAEQDDEVLESVFATLDRDDRGFVRYSEFLAAAELASGKYSRSITAEVFRRFDVENTGYITKENVEQLLSTTSQGEANIQEVLKELSLDDKVRRISYRAFETCLSNKPERKQDDELVKHQKSMSGSTWQSWLHALFFHLENHGTGKLVRQEVDPRLTALECGWIIS